MKKILIITPKFPYPAYGACEQDRSAGIELFLELGYQVEVITKVYAEEYKKSAIEIGKQLGIKIIPIIYKNLSRQNRLKKFWSRLWHFGFWDGAAFEYADPEMQEAVNDSLENFEPDLVWFDYTYLWPLYKTVKQYGLPIITRSINFEPIHFLEESGRSFINYLKFLPKLYSEYLTIKYSDIIFAITPKEKKIYEKMRAKNVEVLPLRGLINLLNITSLPKDRAPLNVFFSGSTYNVFHNRLALEFLIKHIAPLAEHVYPGQFVFHVFGGKVPGVLDKYFTKNVIKKNYVPEEDFAEEMSKMDMAIVPSIVGAGMQQKVFAPLAMGFPTITSKHGLAEYPFANKKEVLVAETLEEYVRALGALRDFNLRKELGERAKNLSELLFSKKNIVNIINNYLS